MRLVEGEETPEAARGERVRHARKLENFGHHEKHDESR